MLPSTGSVLPARDLGLRHSVAPLCSSFVRLFGFSCGCNVCTSCSERLFKRFQKGARFLSQKGLAGVSCYALKRDKRRWLQPKKLFFSFERLNDRRYARDCDSDRKTECLCICLVYRRLSLGKLSLFLLPEFNFTSDSVDILIFVYLLRDIFTYFSFESSLDSGLRRCLGVLSLQLQEFWNLDKDNLEEGIFVRIVGIYYYGGVGRKRFWGWE